MKLAIVTAVWKRPEVFKLFAKSIELISKIRGLEAVVIVAGSEGQKSRRLVKSFGFEYVEMDNRFLSNKFNAAAEKAKSFNPDYLMITGSDDLISVDLMRFYMKQTKKKPDIIGVLDFYYYDLVSKKSMYWSGYPPRRHGEPAGALRMISKRLMKKLDWQPFDPGRPKGIDSGLWRRVNEIDHSRCIFSMKDFGLFAVDVKSETNITPFQRWENCVYLPSEVILNEFEYLPK